ncbi:hypothetical protein [Maribellus sediminis]|uniref:hypothetical protein n=1 Tax=Maribellus sediminis TaxID=2696285 RepID=UPI00142F75A4|nr:hypothetical protein [Maribellus sediminis]
MDPVSVIGAFIMTLAFLAYGLGSITLERFRIVGNVVLVFMTLGIIFETTAIILMMLGSGSAEFNLHMVVGAFAFILLLVNSSWSWLVYIRYGIDASVSKSLLTYTKTAYFVWVLAYLSGIVFLIWT